MKSNGHVMNAPTQSNRRRKCAMLSIRTLDESDWDAVWQFMEPVFRAGETYPQSPGITKDDAFDSWITTPVATYAAQDHETGDIVGSYYIKPNQPTLGAHVCNCGYIVAESARGRGVGSRMCEHSQREAVRLGFRAMQYNLVVSTNEVSFRLWKRHGFHVVGTLPGAFKHSEFGYVDAYVMYKMLVGQGIE